MGHEIAQSVAVAGSTGLFDEFVNERWIGGKIWEVMEWNREYNITGLGIVPPLPDAVERRAVIYFVHHEYIAGTEGAARLRHDLALKNRLGSEARRFGRLNGDYLAERPISAEQIQEFNSPRELGRRISSRRSLHLVARSVAKRRELRTYQLVMAQGVDGTQRTLYSASNLVCASKVGLFRRVEWWYHKPWLGSGVVSAVISAIAGGTLAEEGQDWRISAGVGLASGTVTGALYPIIQMFCVPGWFGHSIAFLATGALHYCLERLGNSYFDNLPSECPA